jgi:hypothetical protein
MTYDADSKTLDIGAGVITCAMCGIVFAVPHHWEEKRRADHARFYCPNGHVLVFNGKTDADRLREELKWAKEDARRQRDAALKAELSLRGTRGALTRVKNRVKNGVCPCCNRSFRELERHMATKHPEWQP